MQSAVSPGHPRSIEEKSEFRLVPCVKYVFIGGETGYIGRALIPRLVAHGHSLTALARKGSEHKIPPGCTIQIGNALDRHYIHCARLRYLHPPGWNAACGPWNGEQFRSVAYTPPSSGPGTFWREVNCWPASLQPVEWLAARIETSRDGAQRFGLVRLDQIIRTLVGGRVSGED